MWSECSVYMAFTKVLSVRSYVSRVRMSLDQRRHNGRITIWHFYVFDFNESPAGESFSLPAPSIKKEDSTATSVSRPVLISTPSSAANNTYLDESEQPSLLGESGVMVLCKGWCMERWSLLGNKPRQGEPDAKWRCLASPWRRSIHYPAYYGYLPKRKNKITHTVCLFTIYLLPFIVLQRKPKADAEI